MQMVIITCSWIDCDSFRISLGFGSSLVGIRAIFGNERLQLSRVLSVFARAEFEKMPEPERRNLLKREAQFGHHSSNSNI